MRRARRRVSLARATDPSVTGPYPSRHGSLPCPPMRDLRCVEMRVGVIDVGSNTTRLLVARRRRGRARPRRQGEGAPLARRGDRALRRVSDVHVAAAAKAVRKHGGDRAAQAGRLARRLPHGARSPGGERRRARRGADARGGRAGPRADDGGGGHARLRRRRPHRRRSAARAHRGLRRRRRLDRDRRRHPGRRAGLDRVGRPRLGPADRTRRATCGPRRGPRSRSLEPPTAETALAVGGSARAATPARRHRARRSRARRGAAARRDELAARDRRRFGVDRARAEILPAGVVAARRGAAHSSASRCTSAPAGSARERCSPRAKRSRRSSAYGAGISCTTSPSRSTTAAPFFRPRPTSASMTSPCVQQTTPSSLSSSRGAVLRALGEAFVELHAQAERGGERLDRLDAPDVRARDDALCTSRGAAARRAPIACRRPRSSSGPRDVVAVPAVRSPGRGVTEEDARHSSSSSGRSRS